MPKARLTDASLAYDAAGQATGVTVAGTGGSPDQVTTFGYDQRGNRLTATSDGVMVTQTYDLANRLTSVTDGAGTTSYGYEASGLRSTATTGAGTERYVWDTLATVATLLSDADHLYVYGGRLDTSGTGRNRHRPGGLASLVAQQSPFVDPAWPAQSRSTYHWLDDADDADDVPSDSCTLPSAVPNLDYPAQSPGEDWTWKGGEKGAWFNPKTGESLRPDLDHGAPWGSHFDWQVRDGGKGSRIYPDGSVLPK